MLMMFHFVLLLCDSATANPVFDVSFGLTFHFCAVLFGYSNYNKITSTAAGKPVFKETAQNHCVRKSIIIDLFGRLDRIDCCVFHDNKCIFPVNLVIKPNF